MTKSLARGNILIVDDTPANLHLLEGMLRERGYKVRPAPNGHLALRAAASDPPDLILLDINMPEMDGFEVCRRLKRDERLSEIPVLFISALTDTEDKVKAFETGGLDYVTKPFQLAEVLARVETHLKLRRYQLELQHKNAQLQETLDELKAAQIQLIQSEKMASLGVLTAGIAHEINNPVNFVSSGAKGLGKLIGRFEIALGQYGALGEAGEERQGDGEVPGPASADACAEILVGFKELVQSIGTGAERTAEIVKGLRTFSRLDEADKKLIDVHENIDSALMLLRNRSKDHITIDKAYADASMLLCYPGKLNQVFMNLLSNAIDAIETGTGAEEEKPARMTGRITVSTELAQAEGRKWLKIAIQDTGDGISDDVREHLFEPFFTTKEVGKGVGLGLAITHGIVQEHDGRIEVETSTGNGATFTVWLPVQE